jgi:hypothetical protein
MDTILVLAQSGENPHWWAQPTATMLAAVIALTAAGVAWSAANRTIQAGKANLQA